MVSKMRHGNRGKHAKRQLSSQHNTQTNSGEKKKKPDKLEEEVPDLPIFALRKPEQSFQSRFWPVAGSCNDHDSVMTSICV